MKENGIIVIYVPSKRFLGVFFDPDNDAIKKIVDQACEGLDQGTKIIKEVKKSDQLYETMFYGLYNQQEVPEGTRIQNLHALICVSNDEMKKFVDILHEQIYTSDERPKYTYREYCLPIGPELTKKTNFQPHHP